MSTEFFNDQWRIPNNKNQSLVSNYSMDFNGVSAGVNCGPMVDLFGVPSVNYNTSYSVWIKPEFDYTTPFYQTFFGNYTSGSSGVLLYYHMGSDTWRFIVGDGVGNSVIQSSAITSNQELGKGEWQHHCVVFDSVNNNAYYYIDGTQVNTSTSLGRDINTYVSSPNFYIGKKWDLTSGKFEGEITQGCIFDYALSTSQRDTLYGGGTAVGNPMSLSPKPIAYYQLGEQSVSTGPSSDYLVPNNSLQDYVFAFAQPIQYSNPGTANTPIIAPNQGSVFSGISNFSFSGWFNIPLYTYFMAFFIGDSSNPYFNINMYGNDLRFNVTPGNSYIEDLQNIVPVNTWFHFAGVFDGSGASDTDRLKLYINGEAQTVLYSTTNPTSFPTIPSGTDINLGKTFSVLTQTTMLSSNIQLWDSSLIPSEVQTLYNNGSPIQTLSNVPQNPNLKLWWKLDSSEIYNSSTTEWGINQAQAYVQNSVFCPNVSGQTVTDYLQVSNYSGTTGKTAASWSFWYNTLEANNQGGWLSGGSAEFKRNNSGQQPGMEFTLYTDVAGVDKTWSTYFAMPYGNWYIQAPESEVLNKWINVVLTYDQSAAPEFGTESGSIILYVNGVKQATSSGTSGGVTNPGYSEFPAEGTIRTGNLIFGGGDYYSRHVSASLSNYATWDKALTQAEINEIVNGGQPKNLSTHSASSNLISWWRLNNLTTGLVDTIGSYNATIVGSNSVVKPGSISQLNGTSSGMSQASLVQSDLSTTTGYSPYALDFDGTSRINIPSFMSNLPSNDIYTISTWIKTNSDTGAAWGSSNSGPDLLYAYVTNGTTFGIGRGSVTRVDISNLLTVGKWANVVAVFDSSTNLKIYINNAFIQDVTVGSLGAVTDDFKIGGALNAYTLSCSQSNVSVWNTALTPTQVTEVYNEGRPSNLNNFSGTAPVAWWQLGSNSSFNATNSQWTCLDEKGTNTGLSSTNMANDDIVNGPGYSANGLGASTIDIVGDAPYSTANGLSENMDVLDRVTDVPS
jgi:hypothetical protein